MLLSGTVGAPARHPLLGHLPNDEHALSWDLRIVETEHVSSVLELHMSVEHKCSVEHTILILNFILDASCNVEHVVFFGVEDEVMVRIRIINDTR
jgi:hypothetical protein